MQLAPKAESSNAETREPEKKRPKSQDKARSRVLFVMYGECYAVLLKEKDSPLLSWWKSSIRLIKDMRMLLNVIWIKMMSMCLVLANERG